MKHLLGFFLLAIAVSGCLSIRSSYQSVAYYRLLQKPSLVKAVDTLTGTMLIRTFTTNEEYNNDHLVYAQDNAKVSYYIYHRWVSEMPGLLTDFITNRYMQSGLFKSGIVQSGSAIVPTYILEGKVLEMLSYNGRDSNYIHLTLQVSLLRTSPMQIEQPVIFQKIYEQQVACKDDAAESIPNAYSDALSYMADLILVDIGKAVRLDGANGLKAAEQR